MSGRRIIRESACCNDRSQSFGEEGAQQRGFLSASHHRESYFMEKRCEDRLNFAYLQLQIRSLQLGRRLSIEYICLFGFGGFRMSRNVITVISADDPCSRRCVQSNRLWHLWLWVQIRSSPKWVVHIPGKITSCSFYSWEQHGEGSLVFVFGWPYFGWQTPVRSHILSGYINP